MYLIICENKIYLNVNKSIEALATIKVLFPTKTCFIKRLIERYMSLITYTLGKKFVG